MYTIVLIGESRIALRIESAKFTKPPKVFISIKITSASNSFAFRKACCVVRQELALISSRIINRSMDKLSLLAAVLSGPCAKAAGTITPNQENSPIKNDRNLLRFEDFIKYAFNYLILSPNKNASLVSKYTANH